MKILLQSLHSFAPQRDDPLFPPLAENTYRPGSKIDPADIKPGHLQGYWPEVNPLIPTRWDPLSEEPDYNAAVRLERL